MNNERDEKFTWARLESGIKHRRMHKISIETTTCPGVSAGRALVRYAEDTGSSPGLVNFTPLSLLIKKINKCNYN